MLAKQKNKKTIIISTLLILISIGIANAHYGHDNHPAKWDLGWKGSGKSTTTVDIKQTDGASYNDCKQVINNNNYNLFIPTKTEKEWIYFKEATPNINVTLCECNVGQVCGAGVCINPGTFSCDGGCTGTTSQTSNEVCDGGAGICDSNGNCVASYVAPFVCSSGATPTDCGAMVVNQRLTAEDATTTNNSLFGSKVAITRDGNIALIGAYKDNEKGTDAGAAYIFTRSGNGTWSQDSKFFGSFVSGVGFSQTLAGDYFGYSVSISSYGNRRIVTARNKTAGSTPGGGAAYIFDESSQLSMVLPLPTLRDENINYGEASAISGYGDFASITERNGFMPSGATSTGAAYIYNLLSTQRYRIFENTLLKGDYFGSSAAISGDSNKVAFGAYGIAMPGSSNPDTSDSGGVYFYSNTGTFDELIRIDSSEATDNDEFGYSIALSYDGNTMVVGAPKKNSNAGYVYVYTYSGSAWSNVRINASDNDTGDRFGHAVDISPNGETIVVGAPKDDENGIDTGAIYVFKKAGGAWASATEDIKFVGSETSDLDFGNSVSISENGTIIVGTNSNAAYIIGGCNWINGTCQDLGSDDPVIICDTPKENTIDIVFVTDISSSMPADNDLGGMKNTLIRSAYTLYNTASLATTTTIKVGAVAFQSISDFEVNASNIATIPQRNNLVTEFIKYYATGNTNITAGLTSANNMFSGSTAIKKVIIFLGDGAPTTGTPQDPTSIANTIKADGIEIYSIAFGAAIGDTGLETNLCNWSSDNGSNCYTGNYSYKADTIADPGQNVLSIEDVYNTIFADSICN